MTYQKFKILLDITVNFVQLGADNIEKIFLWQENVLNKNNVIPRLKASIFKPFDDWNNFHDCSVVGGAEALKLTFSNGATDIFFDITQTTFVEQHPNITLEPSQIFDVNNNILTAYYHKHQILTYENIKTLAEVWRCILDFTKNTAEKAEGDLDNLTNNSVLYILHKYFCTGWAKTVKLKELYTQISHTFSHESLDLPVRQAGEENSIKLLRNIFFDKVFSLALKNIAQIENATNESDSIVASAHLKNLFHNATLERSVVAVFQNYEPLAILPYRKLDDNLSKNNAKLLENLQNDGFLVNDKHTISKYLKAKNVVQNYKILPVDYDQHHSYNKNTSLWEYKIESTAYELVFESGYSLKKSEPPPKATHPGGQATSAPLVQTVQDVQTVPSVQDVPTIAAGKQPSITEKPMENITEKTPQKNTEKQKFVANPTKHTTKNLNIKQTLSFFKKIGEQ